MDFDIDSCWQILYYPADNFSQFGGGHGVTALPL